MIYRPKLNVCVLFFFNCTAYTYTMIIMFNWLYTYIFFMILLYTCAMAIIVNVMNIHYLWLVRPFTMIFFSFVDFVSFILHFRPKNHMSSGWWNWKGKSFIPKIFNCGSTSKFIFFGVLRTSNNRDYLKSKILNVSSSFFCTWNIRQSKFDRIQIKFYINLEAPITQLMMI